MWQQPETIWTVFVGGYLSPGAFYINREVRPQGTDLWIQWDNFKHNEAKRMSIVTSKDHHTSFKNTLRLPGPLDDIGQLWPTFLKSSSVKTFSLLLIPADR